MKTELRVVFDTNVLVSAILGPKSTPRRAFDLAIVKGTVLISQATLAELDEVLSRPKFIRYISTARRLEFLSAYICEASLIDISQSIDACRDQKDNMFLEVAVCGQATVIVTGDGDLLALNPFQGIHVLSPEQFIEGAWIDPADKEEAFQLCYPFFVIRTRTGEVSTFRVGEQECLAAYQTRERAELFLAQSGDPLLEVVTIPNPVEARSLAQAVISQGIDTILWDSMNQPAWFRFSQVSDLLG